MTNVIEYRRPCIRINMMPDALTTKKRYAVTLREMARRVELGSILDLFEIGHALREMSDTAIDLGEKWGASSYYPRETRQ